MQMVCLPRYEEQIVASVRTNKMKYYILTIVFFAFISLSGCEKKYSPDKFITAAVLNDKDSVVQMLKDGVDVNCRDSNNDIALHLVDDLEMAKLLVSFGADINIKNSDGMTPLCSVMNLGFFDIAKYYIDCGADVNVKSNSGMSILHFAALGNIQSCIKLAIENGIDVNVKDNTGTTPLCYAVSSGAFESVVVLVEHGADIFAKDFRNSVTKVSPIWLAVAGAKGDIPNSEQILVYLLIKVDMNKKYDDGNFFIHKAIHIPYLFEKGYIWYVIGCSDINAVDDNGLTVLDYMEKLKDKSDAHEKVYNFLVEHGAVSTGVNKKAFGYAFVGGDVTFETLTKEQAVLMLKQIRDNNYTRDDIIAGVYVNSWFLSFIKHKYTEQAISLLDAISSDPYFQNFKAFLLFQCVLYDNEEMFDYLIKSGADPNLKEINDMSFYEMAERFPKPEIFSKYIEKIKDMKR